MSTAPGCSSGGDEEEGWEMSEAGRACSTMRQRAVINVHCKLSLFNLLICVSVPPCRLGVACCVNSAIPGTAVRKTIMIMTVK